MFFPHRALHREFQSQQLWSKSQTQVLLQKSTLHQGYCRSEENLLLHPTHIHTSRTNMNESQNTLAARGLEELFFQLCCHVSFWFWWEIGFGLHTYALRVPYNCGIVSVFWFWREIVFGMYVLTIQLWCCVSFFGSGRKQFLVLCTYFVYNTVTRLCS